MTLSNEIIKDLERFKTSIESSVRTMEAGEPIDVTPLLKSLSETLTELIEESKNGEPDFGDFCSIEMHCYGCENEHYTHKIIGSLITNSAVVVPIKYGEKGDTGHDEVCVGEMLPALRVVQCGVSEKDVFKVFLKDVKVLGKHKTQQSGSLTGQALDISTRGIH